MAAEIRDGELACVPCRDCATTWAACLEGRERGGGPCCGYCYLSPNGHLQQEARVAEQLRREMRALAEAWDSGYRMGWTRVAGAVNPFYRAGQLIPTNAELWRVS